MKAKEIQVGGRYLAKVNNVVTIVRVDAVRADYAGRTRYDVTNTRTGRATTFRSPSKFRGAAPQG